MLTAILRTLRPVPPSAVMWNFTGPPVPRARQVPRRGTCKRLSDGPAGRRAVVGWGPGWSGRVWGWPRGAGGRGVWSSTEASVRGRVPVLELVEPGVDPREVVVGCGRAGGEPVEVGAEQLVVGLASPGRDAFELPGAERRHSGGDGQVAAGEPAGQAKAGQPVDAPVGDRWAQEAK